MATTPTRPSISNAPQLLRVSGQDFETNLSFTITRPDGASRTYLGDEIINASPSSFFVSLVLETPGDYRLEVRSFGLISPAWTMQVAPPDSGDIVLTGVIPATLSASAQPQTITLTGQNFAAAMSGSIASPQGDVEVPVSIAVMNSTSLLLTHTFSKVGTYAVSVSDGAGHVSNTISVSVQK